MINLKISTTVFHIRAVNNKFINCNEKVKDLDCNRSKISKTFKNNQDSLDAIRRKIQNVIAVNKIRSE